MRRVFQRLFPLRSPNPSFVFEPVGNRVFEFRQKYFLVNPFKLRRRIAHLELLKVNIQLYKSGMHENACSFFLERTSNCEWIGQGLTF